jgi:hypothetical protein
MKKLSILFSSLFLLINLSFGQATNVLQTTSNTQTSGPVQTNQELNAPFPNAALPDSTLMNWDTSRAATPNLVGLGGRMICVGTLVNPSLLPIPCNISLSFATASYNNLKSALSSSTCGDWVIAQNTQYGSTGASPLLPTNIRCPANQYVWVTRDITDTTFPAEGFRVDECSLGIAQSVMPWHPYPSWDTSPNNCPTRHMPQVITQGRVLGGGGLFGFNQGFNVPSISSFRFLGWEVTNDGNEEVSFSLFDLSYNPPIDCALNSSMNGSAISAAGTGYTVGNVLTVSGPSSPATIKVTTINGTGGITAFTVVNFGAGYNVSSIYNLTGGSGTGATINVTSINGASALPIHADFCQNDQPLRVICDQCIIHGDAQRQNSNGVKPAGTIFFALLDSDVYDIGETYAGGGGDASAIPMGTGHGYTGEGHIKIANNFLSASTETATIVGGSFMEPKSPVTNVDGNLTDLWMYQNWVNKNIMWNTQRGQAGNRTINVDGISYPPVPAMELVVSPHTLQLQVGQTYEIHYTLYNYSGQGLDRDVNTVVVDGVTNGNATTGTIIKNGEHNIGTGKWAESNMVTYTYTAPSTVGTHIVQLNSIVQNNTPGASFAHNLTLSDSLTITVVSGTPVKQLTLHPKLPDLVIQPSYSDNNFNTRNFCVILINATNYTPVSFTYTVDGVANGNANVGTIDTTGPAYCSGTQTGNHTITSTSAGGTTDSITINVNKNAPIADVALKAFTSKDTIEFKEGCRILVQFNYFENAWGSNGNGGGQPGETIEDQVLNQPLQVSDGLGNNVTYGPQTTCDINYDHNYFTRTGMGMVLFTILSNGAGYDLGMHRVTVSNNIFDDASWVHNSNGWINVTQQLEIGGTSGAVVPPWETLATPISENFIINHNDFLGDATNTIDFTNNTAHFPLGPIIIENNIFSSADNGTASTFVNGFGDANDCNRASGTGANNNLSFAFLGTFYTPPRPCSQTPYFDYNLFLDSTAALSVFLPSTHIFKSSSTATDLFVSANGLNGGDYRICTGAGIPSAGCTANTYGAGGPSQGNDGLALGADVPGVMAAVTDVVLGIRIPPGTIVPTTTFANEVANNTSACSGNSFIGVFFPSYCNIALPDFKSATANTGVQTLHLSPIGHVSQMTLNTYMYPGATTRWIAAYQPWFNPLNCVTANYNTSSKHPCVGYNENSGSVIAQQHTLMLTEGFTDVSPDWYGDSGNSDSTFINNTVIAEAADLAARCSGTCPLHLMVMVDGGLIVNGMVGATGCPKSNSIDETTCITTVLNKAYDYIDSHWGRQSYYSKDVGSSQPITLTFITKGDWAASNWATVWTNVKTHMAGYATPYKVIEEYGSFTDTAIDGAYGWPQSEAYTSGNQLCWQGGSCSFDYFNNLYINAQANPSKILVGHMFPGFDGSNNNYNNNVTARQCGQLLYLETQKTWVTGTGFTLYSSSNQLPWMLVPTWNDYGEGTNVEDGINNCYTLTASISGASTLSWSLNPTDVTYASTTTIDHFTIWYEDAVGNLYKAADNVPVSTLTTNIGNLIPIGTWTVLVEMVGKPLIHNQMSNGVRFTH